MKESLVHLGCKGKLSYCFKPHFSTYVDAKNSASILKFFQEVCRIMRNIDLPPILTDPTSVL